MRIPYIKLSIVFIVCLCAWLIYLDAHLQKAFSGRLWAQPAQVYARPLELYEGAPLSLKALKQELDMLSYRYVSRPSEPGQATLGGSLVVHTKGFVFDDDHEPARKLSFQIINDRVSGFKSNDGSPIARVEPLSIGSLSPSHSEDRLLVSLADVPKPLQQLLVASEDRSFYQHHGISLRGISRAVLANIKQQRLSQGGSTLTQQLVKNYFLTAERTLQRKLVEIFMSLLLELHLDKDKILESYINEIYLGQDGPRAIHGFGLASEYYFEKPVSRLALHEQALLVALVRGPSYYNPIRNKERAKKRRDLMLDLAVGQQFISAKQAKLAKAKPVLIVKSEQRKSKRMPAYLDLVRRQLQSFYSDDDLSSEGLTVFTHFDPVVQAKTENAVARTMNRLPSSKALQAAAIVAEPNSGNLLAIVGDKNARYPGFNRALDARRHVGSVIKPAVYLSALLKPETFNLLSPLVDEAIEWPLSDGSIWAPQNFDKVSHGDTVLYKALANSYNQATAHLGYRLGLPDVISRIKQLGIDTEIPEYPSVLLGALSLSPLQITQMYQTIAGNGFYAQLNTIRAVMNHKGEVLQRFPLVLEQRFDSESMSLLQFAMNRVTIEGSGKRLASLLPGMAVAGKTGTSSQLRDSWFAGFSGDYVGVVWLGRDDNEPMGLTGAGGALKVWGDLFNGLAKQDVSLVQSERLSFLGYDASTGLLYKANCNRSLTVPFIAANEPEADVSCGMNNVLDDIKKRVFEWLGR